MPKYRFDDEYNQIECVHCFRPVDRKQPKFGEAMCQQCFDASCAYQDMIEQRDIEADDDLYFNHQG